MLSAILVALAVAHAAQATAVVTLTTASFKPTVESASFVMVEFYAPWCGHCKKLAPIWEEAAAALQPSGVVLAQVDATVETELASEYGIEGFPTIKYFTGGSLSGTYEGGREVADIVAFAKAYSGPAVVSVSEEELEGLRETNELVIAAYDPSLVDMFTEVAAKLRTEAIFAQVSSNAKGQAPVVAYKTYDEGVVAATKSDYESTEQLTSFVQNEAMKLFDEMGPQNYRKYLTKGLPIGWLFVKPTVDGPERDEVAKITGKFKGRMSFVWVDAEKYAGISERLGLDGKVFPAFAIDVEQSNHYALPADERITSDTVVAFAERVLSGDVKQTIRSEPAPAADTVDGLTTVVGSTFDALVVTGTKDVLIEFYAPWCGHCKSFAPTYAAVAKAFEGNPNILVAKLDATANDFDMKLFPVRGFPTMYYLPSNSKTPEEYSGDRSEAAVTEFIEARVGSAAPTKTDEL